MSSEGAERYAAKYAELRAKDYPPYDAAVTANAYVRGLADLTEDAPEHVDYPHDPDTLYDCPACDMPD